MKKLLILAMALLFVPAADADIESLVTTIDVDETDASFRVRMLFESPPSGTWEYNTLFSITNLDYASTFDGECTLLRASFGSTIRCDFPEDSATRGRLLTLNFDSEEVITRINGKTLFKADLIMPEYVNTSISQVTLDKGLILIGQDESFLPYSPISGEQGSDGRRIFIVWENEGLAQGDELDFSVVFEKAVPLTPGVNITLIVIGSIIIVMIGVMSLMAYMKKGTLPMLKIDEEKIVEIIKENHGMVKQNRLVNETGFSKAKVSRLVKDMEDRGLIHTKHVGRNNEVYLGKDKAPKTKPSEEDSK